MGVSIWAINMAVPQCTETTFYSTTRAYKAVSMNSILISPSLAFRSLLSLSHSFFFGPDKEPSPTRHDQAFFETTKRLLAEIINEGLLDASIAGSNDKHQSNLYLYLHPRQDSSVADDARWVRVNVRPDTKLEARDGRVAAVVRPDSLEMPVVIGSKEESEGSDEELDPGVLLRFVSPWLLEDAGQTVLDEIALELQNSARNQGKPCPAGRYQSMTLMEDRQMARNRRRSETAESRRCIFRLGESPNIRPSQPSRMHKPPISPY